MSSQYRTLDDAVRQALGELNKAYKSLDVPEGTTIPMRTIQGLMNVYAHDANLQSITSHFADAAKSISVMRSTYLPQELFPSLYESDDDATAGGIIRKEAGGPSISVRISDDFTEKESYENAFMRMLGMPLSNDSRLRGSEAGSALSYITKDGKLIEPGMEGAKTIVSLTSTILDERQKNIQQRNTRIDDEVFEQGDSALILGDDISWSKSDIDKIIAARDAWEELTKQDPPLNDTQLASGQEEVLGKIDYTTNSKLKILWDVLMSLPNIYNDFKELVESAEAGEISSVVKDWLKENTKKLSVYFLHEDFFAYKNLMVPPVQDSRISKCLGEPSKIVASFFSDSTQTINNKTVKPSLLEAVIRIRFDRASGQSTARQLRSGIPGAMGMTHEVNLPDSYGALEALLVVRLRSAIGAYARNVRDNIEKLTVYKQTLRTKVSEHEARTANASVQDSRIVQRTIDDRDLPGNFLKLDHEKTVELAILTLFGNTAKVPGFKSFVDRRYSSSILDAEVGNLRTSSVIDAHLVGPTLNVVGLPLVAINEKLSEMRTGLMKRGSGKINETVSDIRTILGITNGVGAIDVAVFSLALFSLKETLLLGLLPKEKMEEMMNSEQWKPLITSTQFEQADLLVSINSLTKLIYEGYSLFVEELKSFKYEEDIARQRTTSGGQ